MRSSYSIVVTCSHCHKEDPIKSFVSKDKFLQGYIDRRTVYFCLPCWNKKEKGELEISTSTQSRFELMIFD